MKPMRWAGLLLILVTSAASAVAQNHIAGDPQRQNPNTPSQRANDIQADYPGQTHGDFVIKDFRFHNGEMLSDLRLHYFTLGTPQRDKSGQIDNAVLLLH
jgi:homoserine acetyltransferase